MRLGPVLFAFVAAAGFLACSGSAPDFTLGPGAGVDKNGGQSDGGPAGDATSTPPPTEGRCPEGRGDCNGNVEDGCETDLGSAHDHCGSCTTVCASEEVCSKRACKTGGCGEGLTSCGGSCVDVTNDPSHCGSCPKLCPTPANGTATCEASSCDFTCDAGFVPSGASCVPAAGNCNAPTTCATAQDLGTISGDTVSATHAANGSTSQWLKIRVTEDDMGVIAVPLRLQVTLVSPPGTNFDLHLYVNAVTDIRECVNVTSSATLATPTDVANLTWGELGAISDGAENGRVVSIEVRHVSGPCAPSAKWTLTAKGN